MNSPRFALGLALASIFLHACASDGATTTLAETGTSTTESGDGDGDSGDGDGDSGDGDGDSGDGDGDGDSGDGDGDSGDGDGDGDGENGDGDGDGDTGDGDGDGNFVNGDSCTLDEECASGNCFVIPFLGGRCGECNEDLDCPDGGCSGFYPGSNEWTTCNLGEQGAGCETDAACQPGLSCVFMFDLLGLMSANTCSPCTSDLDCQGLDICVPVFDLPTWEGSAQCIPPGSLPQDSSCELGVEGDQACGTGICSVVDIMGLQQIGACGLCNDDSDCGAGFCAAGEFILETGELTGSTCQP